MREEMTESATRRTIRRLQLSYHPILASPPLNSGAPSCVGVRFQNYARERRGQRSEAAAVNEHFCPG